MAIDFPVVNSDPSLPWLNPDTGITYIYKDGAWRVLSSTDFEDLEDLYVNVPGDTMTGELSLSAAGTVDILQDALSVYHDGNYNAFIDWGGNAAFYDLIGEDAHFTRSVEVGATGDVKITLNANGSASFAGDVAIDTSVPNSLRVNYTGGNANATVFSASGGGTQFFRVRGGGRVNIGANANTNDPEFLFNEAGILHISNTQSASNPKIKLNGTDGSATFAGDVTLNNTSGEQSLIGNRGRISLKRVDTTPALEIFNTTGATTSNTGTVRLYPDGSARFLGGVATLAINSGGGSLGVTADGSALRTYYGWNKAIGYKNDSGMWTLDNNTGNITGNLLRSAGFQIELERDNDDNYTVTTDLDEEGNTVENRVYNGPTLDVKDRLQNLIARLDAIEANEVVDDATDNSLLLAVAELTSRLNERDALITTLTTRIEALENA